MKRNRPIPAEIASLRLRGIELITYSRSGVTEMMNANTPETNTKPSACCHVYL